MRDFEGSMHDDSPDAMRLRLSARVLPYVDPRELIRRISAFRKLDFHALSRLEVSDAIADVIMFDTPEGPHGIWQVYSKHYPAGTRFFRVRAIPEDDHIIPLRTVSKVADCWEPPAEIVKLGRLNEEHEPLLYTSTDSRIAVDEMKIPDGARLALIVYEAVGDVNVVMVGDRPKTDGLSEADALKLEIVHEFLRDEFIRDVGQGTEYLYRISETIAKDYFDMPPEFQDAWCYPSLAHKEGFNVAFRPTTRTMLRLVGVQFAEVYREPEDQAMLFRVACVAKGMEGADDLTYFRIGSPEQQAMFPEISTYPEPEPPGGE